MKGEEAGLEIEGLAGAVIPYGEISASDFFSEGELGGDHVFGERGREAAGIDEAGELGAWRAGDYDDFIEVGFGGGFK